MSLDKAILHGKTKRHELRGSASYDKSCRCHGDCPYCASNRLHQANKELARMLDQLDYYNEYKNKLNDKKEEE